MKPSPIALTVASFVAAVIVGPAAPARAQTPAQSEIAQNYPWCLMSSAFEGGENCGFATHDQCMASRLGIGGFCQINTQYQSSVAPGPSPRAPHRFHQPS